MKNTALSIKLRLFLPIAIIIVIIIVVITTWFISNSISTFNKHLEQTLELEVLTISRMFERENILKLDKVKSNLKLVDKLFNLNDFRIDNTTFEIEAENQITGLKNIILLRKWYLNNSELYNNNSFVDSMQLLVGGTVTIFQKTDSGFVRMTTNINKSDGSRAVGTYIPHNSPVAQAVNAGESYIGRAYILDDWYITAYKPFFFNGELQGMIYVGYKEKDIEELKKIISELTIGKSGYPFVFDKNGLILIHPEIEGSTLNEFDFWENIKNKQKGIFQYIYNKQLKTLAFIYFEPFELYIAASIINEIENKDFIRSAIAGTSIVSLIAAIALLALIYYFTSKRLFRYVNRLQASNKRIESISEALEESEERFQKLFDSTGDDIFVTDEDENIVEVNHAACKTLGYEKKELLKMKITEIKTPKYRENVAANRKIIYETSSHTFESEHVRKDGTVIPVEFLSRVVSYKHEKLILSVVRNLTQRKEIERKILSTIILTEERERERFAKDMHDGLGPLLSTIKLYVNELKSMHISLEEREDLIKTSNEIIDEAVNATRTISNNLMPRIINTYGLLKAVDDFCQKINKTNKLSISFETENIIERLNHDIELILFRVISELINNTIKHAKAEKVIILLVRFDTKVALYYKDDGIGFNKDEIMNSEHKGMGLKNIISRVKSINGAYQIISSQGHGFSIKIEFNI
ncbi:MAG: Cache 3/Cache 2 fusion domain-containing protein [Bacteroidales bacterium]|nr:Cache 3/Cache 2 fusion domain-containing protein [Bacteroidales bacterium]